MRAGAEAAVGTLAAVAGATLVDGIYGTLTINPDGSYSYTLDDARAATQALTAGQQVSDIFTYQVADAHGLVDLAQLGIGIAGADEGSLPGELTGTAALDRITGTDDAETIRGLRGMTACSAPPAATRWWAGSATTY